MAACQASVLSTSLSFPALSEDSPRGIRFAHGELCTPPLFTLSRHLPVFPRGPSEPASLRRQTTRFTGRSTTCFSCRAGSLLPEAPTNESDNPREKVVPLPIAKSEEKSKLAERAAPAVAALIAAAVLLGSPSEGLAASSGGRVGGSKFKSSAPSRSAPPRSSGGGGGSRSYNNYNLNIHPPSYAPPVYGGGYGGYYGGGVPFFGGGVPFFGPTFYVGGGGLLQFILIPIILYVVLNVVGSFFRNRD